MQFDIYSHYTETVPGSYTNLGLVGGYFYPEGDGILEKTLKLKPTGRVTFDPKTGAPRTSVLAKWTGNRCGVQIIERAIPGAQGEAKAYVWISATDCSDVTHTVEFAVTKEYCEFGYLQVAIKE